MSQTAGISRRQQAIMKYIREYGTAQVETLAESFKVTPQTIRRDLNLLYDRELVQRVHGGAILKDNVENLGYRSRKILMAEEKSAIAKRAADLLPNNVSLFINIGTTTEKVAEYLASHRGLLVITNNINVASLLWPNRAMEVIVANGTIRHEDGGIVGSSTEEFIRKFKVDYAIIGCSSIEDGEIFDFDFREVRVAQAIIKRARSIILVTDSIKFSRRAPICLGKLSQIDYLVTDDGIPERAIKACRDSDVHLEIVDVSSNLEVDSNTTMKVNYGN